LLTAEAPGTGRRSTLFPKKTPVNKLDAVARATRLRRGLAMLYWALVFLVIAVIAGLLGFGGVASTAAGIAQVLFFIFLVVFVIALVMGLGSRGPPPVI